MNGCVYRLPCEGGAEQRLGLVGSHVQTTLDKLVANFGQIGEMAVVTIDELMDFF